VSAVSGPGASGVIGWCGTIGGVSAPLSPALPSRGRARSVTRWDSRGITMQTPNPKPHAVVVHGVVWTGGRPRVSPGLS
jgi:hypothetical protein